MKKLILMLLVAVPGWANTLYRLEFKSAPALDFVYELYELPPIFADKIGTNGTITDVRQLTPIRELKGGEVQLAGLQNVLIGLVVKSKSGKAADFFVSPHHIHPAAKGLDFKFECLCYHHAYHLEKGKMWYRVMKLSNVVRPSGKRQTVVLTHDVVPWTKELK